MLTKPSSKVWPRLSVASSSNSKATRRSRRFSPTSSHAARSASQPRGLPSEGEALRSVSASSRGSGWHLGLHRGARGHCHRRRIHLAVLRNLFFPCFESSGGGLCAGSRISGGAEVPDGKLSDLLSSRAWQNPCCADFAW